MCRRHSQYVSHIAAARIPGPHCICPISLRDFPLLLAKIHNNLDLLIETVYMAGVVVFWIRHKPNTIEPNRAHVSRIRQFSYG